MDILADRGVVEELRVSPCRAGRRVGGSGGGPEETQCLLLTEGVTTERLPLIFLCPR